MTTTTSTTSTTPLEVDLQKLVNDHFAKSPELSVVRQEFITSNAKALEKCETNGWDPMVVLVTITETMKMFDRGDTWEQQYLAMFYAYSLFADQRVRNAVFSRGCTPAVKKLSDGIQTRLATLRTATAQEGTSSYLFYQCNASLVERIAKIYQA